MRILFLPGLDGTASLRSEFSEAMAPAHKVDLVTYPGDQVMSYAGYAEFVHHLLPVDEDFWIIGESFSGPIALMIARQQPAGLKGIILAASFASNPSRVPAIAGYLMRWMPFHLNWYRHLSAKALFGDWLTPERKAALDAAVRKVAIPVLTARVRAVLTIDCSDLLAQITLPVLYLQAGKDRIIKQQIGEQIVSVLPHAELKAVNAPHFLLSAEPVECARLVDEFISRHRNPNLPEA